ncbi:MAG: metal ABC transporter permease [Aerococcus urinaeequi]
MEMFQYEFMGRAFIAATAISFISPILGLLLIMRKQSLMADTLAHISLAGVALGYLLGVEPTITTILFVAAAALILEYLRVVYAHYSDISVAMMMSGGMALALLLLNQVDSAASINAYLFGSIVTVSSLQVYILIGLSVFIVAGYLIFKRPLYLISFDENTAYTAGLPVRMISVIFSIITGMAIALIMPIAGSLLVSAIIVMPAAIALRLVKNFDSVIIVGVIIAMFGMFAGLTTSYYLDTPPGATIVAIFVLIFIIESGFLKITKG